MGSSSTVPVSEAPVSEDPASADPVSSAARATVVRASVLELAIGLITTIEDIADTPGISPDFRSGHAGRERYSPTFRDLIP
jgi:hypothetical protein